MSAARRNRAGGGKPMLLGLLLLAAPTLSPGLWETRNEPGKATLDGRPLDDLPIGEIKTDRICATRGQLADPARWLGRDLAADCTLDPADLRGGAVAIHGVCAATAERGPGEVTLTGRYDAARYDVGFTTSIRTSQGTMTFSGRMTGRRVGDCDDDRKDQGK